MASPPTVPQGCHSEAGPSAGAPPSGRDSPLGGDRPGFREGSRPGTDAAQISWEPPWGPSHDVVVGRVDLAGALPELEQGIRPVLGDATALALVPAVHRRDAP